MRKIKVKRVYDSHSKGDGTRVLVDRLWPRGLLKNDAKINDWTKEIAPSNELRKWFQHDPHKWIDFKKKYFAELDSNTENVEKLLDIIGKRTVTFVFGTKEEKYNNAVALKEYLDAEVEKAERERPQVVSFVVDDSEPIEKAVAEAQGRGGPGTTRGRALIDICQEYFLGEH